MHIEVVNFTGHETSCTFNYFDHKGDYLKTHILEEFVVESLIEYFNYTAETAEQITIDIHQAGQATVAVLPFEVAEQKGIEVTLSARSQSYPLQIKLEPETVN
jgi:ATP-dependent Clp protease adaptor protein ClpS